MMYAQIQERPAFVLDVARMDYTQALKPFSSHSKFQVWQGIESPSKRVVYSVTFTDAANHPAGPFNHATEAILFALKTLGEIKQR